MKGLRGLDLSEEDYYHSLSIFPDSGFEVHLTCSPNSGFVNNYFEAGLDAWEAFLPLKHM